MPFVVVKLKKIQIIGFSCRVWAITTNSNICETFHLFPIACNLLFSLINNCLQKNERNLFYKIFSNTFSTLEKTKFLFFVFPPQLTSCRRSWRPNLTYFLISYEPPQRGLMTGCHHEANSFFIIVQRVGETGPRLSWSGVCALYSLIVNRNCERVASPKLNDHIAKQAAVFNKQR